MVRPAVQETHAIEKVAYYPRGGSISYHAEPHGEAPGSGLRQREREELCATAFIVVSVGRNKRGKVHRFWID